MFIKETFSLDIIEWLNKLHKPKDVPVENFVGRLEDLNSIIAYSPNINNVKPVPLPDVNKCIILKKACPRVWQEKMTQANLNFTGLIDFSF